VRIFVDADSCPRLARELLIRAAKRLKTEAIFAANRLIPGIEGEFLRMELCPDEEGAADDFIAEQSIPGDLAITRDVPLAARLVAKSVAVLDDRGRVYTKENIYYYLSLRDFSVSLAEGGVLSDRRPHYGKKELKAFANSFDKIIASLRSAQRAPKTI
jgi:uncharacterized protein YaiI (UPF0178 family)